MVGVDGRAGLHQGKVIFSKNNPQNVQNTKSYTFKHFKGTEDLYVLYLLFTLDDGQSFSHQFLVDPTEVGYFLLAFMMDVHATLCTENTALPQV